MSAKKKKNDKTELILLAVLGVLILFSGVQAYELTEIKKDLAEVRVSPTASSGGAGAPAAQQVQRLQDLPQMVGGC